MLVAELQRRRMPNHHRSSAERRRLPGEMTPAMATGGGGRQTRARKITRLVTTVVIVYVICWLPYWTFQVIAAIHCLSIL